MTAYNFYKKFADPIRLGHKVMTIRAPRKDGRHAKPGDKLQLYIGMRTKGCRKLMDVRCTGQHAIRVELVEFNRGLKITVDGKKLTRPQMYDLVAADGLSGMSALLQFLETSHSLPFEGFIIRWNEGVAPWLEFPDAVRAS